MIDEMKLVAKLTFTNLKMYIRDKSALFWSLFFPFLVISIFGVLDFGKFTSSKVGLIYDESNSEIGQRIETQLESVGEMFKVSTGNFEDEMKALENDDRALILHLENNKLTQKIDVTAYKNKAEEQSAEVIFLSLQKIFAEFELKINRVQPRFNIESKTVNVFDLSNTDYMVPGVIAMSLMQGGIFGVVGTIVTYREKGILKRLFATPLKKGSFFISQIFGRLFISIAQVAILLVSSYVIFDIKIVGNLWLFAGSSVLGSLTFLSLGFVFSGISKSEESARAISMPIQMVLMFTGGVYFSRDVLPNWLYDVTAYSPLTYLADSLRNIMTRGYTLANATIRTASIGLLIWLIGLILIAIKTFKLEK